MQFILFSAFEPQNISELDNLKQIHQKMKQRLYISWAPTDPTPTFGTQDGLTPNPCFQLPNLYCLSNLKWAPEFLLHKVALQIWNNLS